MSRALSYNNFSGYVHSEIQNVDYVFSFLSLELCHVATTSVHKSLLSNPSVQLHLKAYGSFVLQVYAEAYTCPSIKCHTSEQYFVAQSNGNYIAIFSAKAPFKLDKYRRYESHGVSGFPVKCDFNLDGEQLASGSSDGCIYFYNSRSTELIKKVKLYEHACIDVAFHPVMPNVVASCSWNGDISVLE